MSKIRISKMQWMGIILSGFFGFLMHPTVIAGMHLPDMGFLAWIYLVPLILVLQNQNITFKRLLGLCLLSSIISHYGLLFWLVIAMKQFGGMTFLQSFGVLTAQVLIFGFFFALFCSLALKISEKTSLPLWLTLPLFMVCRDALIHYFPLGGYPWGIPPYSQKNFLFLYQWIEWTGTYGLSLFIYAINALGAAALMSGLKPKKNHRKMVIYFGVLALMFVASWFTSRVLEKNFAQNATTFKKIKLALIQANISQDIKWNAKKAEQIVMTHVAMTEAAIEQGAELVLWAETTYPFALNQKKLPELTFLERDNWGAHLFVGSGTVLRENKELKRFNTIFHISPAGEFASFYAKRHLVPFGEFNPFAELLPFTKKLTQGFGYFTPGDKEVLFDVMGIKFAPLICIEDVFMRYGREFSKHGADVLVNFTNDAWYGDSSAQHQHVVYSQLRAMENRRYVLRATNTGVTAIINPLGKIVASRPPFTKDTLLHDLAIETKNTFYSQHGDIWILLPTLFLSGMMVLYTLIKRRML